MIFEIDALQPWIVPAQSFGLDKSFQQPFLGDPVNAADQRLSVVRNCFEDVGEVTLKGFGSPVRAHAAAWKQAN